MATYVTIVNRVLRRLREDTVTSYTDTDYGTLIGDLVNETIAEMQSRCEWRALRDQFTITTDGSREYALTSAESANSRDSNHQLVIRAVFNDTGDYDLQKAPSDAISRLRLYTTDPTELFWYRETGLDSSDRRKVELYPDVSGKTIVFETYNPYAEISSGATQVVLPAHVVTLGAYARAVDERGEDSGTAASSAWNLYTNALADAIVTEVERQTDCENDWRPV